MSFLWGVISSLPHSLGLSTTVAGNQSTVLLGAVIYTAGLFMESLADYQKWMWKLSYPGKFCSGGLWSISQHPNFFGNFMIWSGIAVMNLSALIEPIAVDNGTPIALLSAILWSCHKAVVALLSPVFLWMFFSGQASGSIGSGVEESMKRYGDDAEFRKYIDSVPLFVPDLRRIYDNK
jgi:steroid 5-alpha reductase family enzyme